ncbi:DNA translocase FtsK [Lusitaniella coriacea]|uniref:DNA translocase FtsK n=1 Tax=Lusitaniella coriacea TaxID=1983105 RepID=UPI003CED6A95
MIYLQDAEKIKRLIAKLTTRTILWLDTEVADWQTKNPRLSLIQVGIEREDLKGDRALILDVLDRKALVADFMAKIMQNPQIEKVFHNSSYDLRFLGGKTAQNVTCTWKLSKKISLDVLGTDNRKLKTLASQLCGFSDVDSESGTSDWGQRPLSAKQLQYAKMDVVYLAQVHRRLLELNSPQKPWSVTTVQLALECPRLFYLKERFGGNTLFIPQNHEKGIGSIFHQFAYEFMELAKEEPQFSKLFEPAASQLDDRAIARQMQQLFYQLNFFPHLQEETEKQQDRAQRLLPIWTGLTQLIQHWAKLLINNRKFYPGNEVISRTLIDGEVPLEYTFTLPNGHSQTLIGKLDSLMEDGATRRLCVAEYKTYEPLDFSAHLAQVALYSYMLAKQKRAPVDAAIYCVLPEFKESRYAWEKLEEAVRQRIPQKLQQMQDWLKWEEGQPHPPPPTTQPHLCEICPQQETCQSFFNPPKSHEHPIQLTVNSHQSSVEGTGNGNQSIVRENSEQSSPRHPITPSPCHQKTSPASPTLPVTPPPTLNPEPIGEQLVAVMKSFKVDVAYLGAVVGTSFIRVKLKPNLGVKVASLLKLSDDLQVQMGCPVPPMIATQPGYVSVDLPREDRQIARFEDYIQRKKHPVGEPVMIALGIDLDGKLVEADLSDPNTCHFLVGGTTGSGKSEFLRSILLSLLYRHSPQSLQIILVDPKRVTFFEFEEMAWLRAPVVKESDRAIELMEELVIEMEQRYQKFEAAKCANIDTYNQKHSPPLPRIVCIFDEYADFMAEKATRSTLEQSIKRLGSMARAAGIHLIIATQRPEANIVTPIIRSNLPGRIALRTASEADSAIILGGKPTEAAYLLGKGDLLYFGGAQLHRLQSLYAVNNSL